MGGKCLICLIFQSNTKYYKYIFYIIFWFLFHSAFGKHNILVLALQR